MAPVEIDHVPVAAVKSLKVVDKAMSLPLVSSACSEVTRMTSPYVESTLSMVTPMMETTWSKNKMRSRVPHHHTDQTLPSTLSTGSVTWQEYRNRDSSPFLTWRSTIVTRSQADNKATELFLRAIDQTEIVGIRHNPTLAGHHNFPLDGGVSFS